MYKIKIGCMCCIVLFLSFAGCGKKEQVGELPESRAELTKTTEQTDIKEEPEKADKPEHRIEMELVEYTYPFYELWCAANAEDSYEVTDDGACRVVFSAKYNKIIFALPEGINMALCDHVTVKARCEYGRFGAYMYDKAVYIDPWDHEVYPEYDLGGEGVRDYSLYPNLTCDVWGVGIAAMDEVEDFSQYVVDVYSVTFYMKTEYQAK